MSKKKRPRKLSIRQERFAIELPVDWNQTAAALRAGYSKRSARQSGYDNMKNPYILKLVQEEIKRLAENAEMDADEAFAETVKIARANILDFMEWDEEKATFVPSRDLTREQAAAVGEIQAETTTVQVYGDEEAGISETRLKLKIKMIDKLRALDQLHRIFGRYQDKVDVTHHGMIPITEVEIARPKEEEEK